MMNINDSGQREVVVARVDLLWFEKFGDPSYGTYVLAFTIQMMLAEFGYSNFGKLDGSIGMIEFMALSVVLSTLAGYFSWHILEKHALKFKNGVRHLGTRQNSSSVSA